jgi:hypothetical protein
LRSDLVVDAHLGDRDGGQRVLHIVLAEHRQAHALDRVRGLAVAVGR